MRFFYEKAKDAGLERKERRRLAHSDEVKIQKAILEMLLEKAELQGHLTREDILEAFQEEDLEPGLLHTLMHDL